MPEARIETQQSEATASPPAGNSRSPDVQAATHETSAGAEAALHLLERDIEAGRVEVYRSVRDVPYITFRQGDCPRECFRLYDRRVEEWLTNFVWQSECGLLLKHSEVDRLLTALAGRAMANRHRQIDDPELLTLLETEPVLCVVLEYAEANNLRRWEGSMETLWKTWQKFAAERGLLRLGKSRFPGGANVLSRKLSELKPVLERLGIAISIRRSNGCQVVVERLDDGEYEPSSEPSTSNRNPNQDLREMDDMSELLANLRARKGTGNYPNGSSK